MKAIVLIISMLVITTSSNALNLRGFSKEEKVVIKTIIEKNKYQKLIEISRNSSTQFMTVIEFTNLMYVLDHITIESIYVLGDSDWKKLQSLDEAYSYEQEFEEIPQAIVFNFNTDKEKRIEIQPINGTPSWHLYYQDSFWDNRVNATVYYNDDIMIILGEDYVIYEDSLDSWRFNFPKCIEESIED
jgi:hypothetical protein